MLCHSTEEHKAGKLCVQCTTISLVGNCLSHSVFARGRISKLQGSTNSRKDTEPTEKCADRAAARSHAVADASSAGGGSCRRVRSTAPGYAGMDNCLSHPGGLLCYEPGYSALHAIVINMLLQWRCIFERILPRHKLISCQNIC